MKTLLAVAALATGLAMPAMAMTDAECDALWRKADTNSDGMLTEAEASRYLAAMRVHETMTPADRRIAPADFKKACLAGHFESAKMDPNAPLKGANSFTEGQARDRALAAGLSDVSALKKDDDGIWRGTAIQDGKSVRVAIDFKGNVVGQP